jgi:hypothetical protein
MRLALGAEGPIKLNDQLSLPARNIGDLTPLAGFHIQYTLQPGVIGGRVDMGWIVALGGLAFLVYLKFRALDKYSFHSLFRYSLMLAAVVGVVILWVLVSIGKN